VFVVGISTETSVGIIAGLATIGQSIVGVSFTQTEILEALAADSGYRGEPQSDPLPSFGLIAAALLAVAVSARRRLSIK